MRAISLAGLLAVVAIAGAADRTFPGLQYRPVGQPAGGRVAQAVGIPGNPLIYYVAADGGGVWKSADGGLSFQPIFDGQPASQVGAIAVAPSDKNVVYVGAENGIYRSADAGKRWKHVWNEPAEIAQLAIDPTAATVAYAAVGGRPYAANKERGVYRTRDGGKTWVRVLFKDAETGATAVVIDADNPRVVWAKLQHVVRKPWATVADERTTHVSRDGGDTWEAAAADDFPAVDQGRWIDPANPKRVIAVRGGAVGISTDGGRTWHSPALPLVDVPHLTAAADVSYSSAPGGRVFRHDRRTGQSREVGGVTVDDGKYRFAAAAPVLVSRHDPKTVYHAGNVLFRTTGGQTWDKVSGDLTRDDKNKRADGYGTVSVVSESPANKKVLWTGSDDGRVHLSQDAAYTWKDVTPGIADLPDWAAITGIEPSPHDEATTYVAADARQLDDPRPYVWKTTDFGDTWTRVSAGLPAGESVRVVRADPKKKGLLYAGTDRGVWFSADDGKSWRPLKLNMPTVAVGDLAVTGDDLLVGTLGRGVCVLDDLTPVRQWSPAVAAKTAHLFQPLPAVRWHQRQNVPTGAVFSYYLKSAAKKPIVLDVYDANNKRIATVTGTEPAAAGVNRLLWDLRHDGTGTPGERGPLVAPGLYTVKLLSGGQTLTAPLEVRMDPRVTEPRGVSTLKFPPQLIPVPPRTATPDEIARLETAPWLSRRTNLDVVREEAKDQEQFSLRVRDEIGRAAGLTEELRLVRRQLELHQELLAKAPKAKGVLKLERALDAKLKALESRVQRGARGRLAGLLAAVTEGDGPPTQSQRQLADDAEQALAEAAAEWARVTAEDLPPLNDLARRQNAPMIWIRPGKP